MFNELLDVPFFILVTIVIIVLYTTSRRHRERMEMIKKGMIQSLYTEPSGSKSGSKTLFLGLLGAATGLAFLISTFFVHSHGSREGMIITGTLFLFGGGAMLLYWKLTAKERERERRLREEHFARIAESNKETSKDKTGDSTEVSPEEESN